MSGPKAYDCAAEAIRRAMAETTDQALARRELVRLATLAASSHNTQPWRFRLARNEVTVLPDFARRCPVVDPDDAPLFKSLGCAVENLIHAASAEGFCGDLSIDEASGAIAVRQELEGERALLPVQNGRAPLAPYSLRRPSEVTIAA